MGLIARVGKNDKHLMFCCVRGKNSNVSIERISFGSVKDVEDGLLAMYIVEKQRQKEYVRQLTEKLHKPKNHEELKAVKRICRKRGYDKFVDNGISYKFIAKNLNIQLNKVSAIIKYAVKHCMLNKHTHIRFMIHVDGAARKVVSYLDTTENLFSTNDNIYAVYANTYSLPSDWEYGSFAGLVLY